MPRAAPVTSAVFSGDAITSRRGVHREEEERPRPRVLHVVARPGRDQRAGPRPGAMQGTLDGQDGLALDHVHDLVAGVRLLRPVVLPGSDGHDRGLAPRGLLPALDALPSTADSSLPGATRKTTAERVTIPLRKKYMLMATIDGRAIGTVTRQKVR